MVRQVVYPGLVSVSFRNLDPSAVVALAARCGLVGIEWGGDVHVPHGDLERARQVAAMTSAAGLAVAAYGSYYAVGDGGRSGKGFDEVLETAQMLGAPLIRVWAGKRGSREADENYRRQVIQDARQVAARAAAVGIRVAYEFHGNTLTDTADSAADLLAATADAGVSTCWQPPIGMASDACLRSLERIQSCLANLHVFHWIDGYQRCPLADGTAVWASYLRLAARAPLAPDARRWAMLELVRGDDPEQLAADADVLRRLLTDAGLAQVDQRATA
jgi:3-dehydroshikimate dehydratase